MDKQTSWIDFQDIKSRVTLKQVLEHYGILEKLKPSGSNLVGCCPIHQGTNKRQFSVNLKKNIFNCFGNCKSGGNVLDFVAKMEKVSLRDAGLWLQKTFAVTGEETPVETQKEENRKEEQVKNLRSEEQSETVNKPLSFELRTLERKHPFFKERNICSATVKHFKLGYCTRGIMRNRIVIPIHNEKGELIAYCGRAIDEDHEKHEGKYKLPPNFTKSAVVYNLHRQKDTDTLIIVESFLSVFRFWQAGIKNVVSLMGSDLSDCQERLIVDFLGKNGKTILIFDGDDAGRACTCSTLERLSRELYVKVIDIEGYAQKPHQLKPDELKALL